MQKLPFLKSLCAVSALLILGFSAGCQSESGEAEVEPAYVVGVTPIGMRLDPIIWGTLSHFDIVSVDGQPTSSKSRVNVPPGEHTLVINAVSGWSGKSNTSDVTFTLKSGHTYLLRPTNISGSIFVIVIDNDEGMVVFRPQVTVVEASATQAAPREVAAPAPPPPAPKKPDSLEYNADGSLKTKSVYETDAKGRVTSETVYDGLGALQYTDYSYYADDGRVVRTDRRDASGLLERVVVYFDSFETILDRNGSVIGTQDLPKSSK
jgi:hypothetical protein